MWNNKTKAVTFSYDDGVTQDQRLIEIFNRYGLKATFNINSGKLGDAGSLIRKDRTVAHVKPRACEVRDIYAGHEIAAHTVSHPDLKKLSEEDIVREVEQDRLALSEIAGYEVVGMAYPGGGTNYDLRVADVIRRRTGVRYCRTIEANGLFAPQSELLTFHPTVWHGDWDELFALGEKFLEADGSEPMLLYVWGHAYEFDIDNSWARFEEFCKLIGGREDVFYGTNREVLLG
ncbi:MAG: polysaccharide deacetylase family protein [Clostridia bacterium]|nr:polysaccharide deacetylase family protein [Clostridia bacterium]